MTKTEQPVDLAHVARNIHDEALGSDGAGTCCAKSHRHVVGEGTCCGFRACDHGPEQLQEC